MIVLLNFSYSVSTVSLNFGNTTGFMILLRSALGNLFIELRSHSLNDFLGFLDNYLDLGLNNSQQLLDLTIGSCVVYTATNIIEGSSIIMSF